MLTPDKVRYECGVKINEKMIPDTARASKYVASWCKKNEYMKPNINMDPIGVTIHNTEDLDNVHDDAEQYTRATWPNCNMSGVVVHYYVDDVCAWQNLREDEPGWHAADGKGDGNRRTIAIECIMDGSGSTADLAARDNAARLIASIMHRHGWGLSNLYTHNHWMGQPDKIVPGVRKNCPIYILPKYEDFKKLVQTYLDSLNKTDNKKEEKPKTPAATTSAVTTPVVSSSTDFKVGDKVKIKVGAKYGGASSLFRGKTVPTLCIGVQYTISKIQTNKGVKEALLKEIVSWVALSSLESAGKTLKVGSKVKIKSGAKYGGLSTSRGKAVPSKCIGVIYTVKKIQTNKGVKEALISEIQSWVPVDKLTIV